MQGKEGSPLKKTPLKLKANANSGDNARNDKYSTPLKNVAAAFHTSLSKNTSPDFGKPSQQPDLTSLETPALYQHKLLIGHSKHQPVPSSSQNRPLTSKVSVTDPEIGMITKQYAGSAKKTQPLVMGSIVPPTLIPIGNGPLLKQKYSMPGVGSAVIVNNGVSIMVNTNSQSSPLKSTYKQNIPYHLGLQA